MTNFYANLVGLTCVGLLFLIPISFFAFFVTLVKDFSKWSLVWLITFVLSFSIIFPLSEHSRALWRVINNKPKCSQCGQYLPDPFPEHSKDSEEPNNWFINPANPTSPISPMHPIHW